MEAAGYGKPKTPPRPAAVRKATRSNAPRVPGYGQSLTPPHSTAGQIHRYMVDHPHDPLVQAARTAGVFPVAVAHDMGSLPGRIYGLATHPERPQKPLEGSVVSTQIAEGLGRSLKQDASDAAHGHITPNVLLDASALLSGGASLAGRSVAASRALREGGAVSDALAAAKARPVAGEVLPRRLVGDAETGTRRVRLPEGGSVQPLHQSPNLITAAGQHTADRLSERIPNVPVVGARSRVRRIVSEAQAIRDRRAASRLIPLTQATGKLRSKTGRGVTAREAAYSAVSSFGHGPEGVKLLDADIARRESRIQALPGLIQQEQSKLSGLEGAALKGQQQRVARLENELRAQPLRIKAWKAARPFVLAPEKDQALSEALAAGRTASEETTASRVARERIKPETAQESTNRHSRIASGAEFVPETASRTGAETPGLKQARMRVTSLQRRYDRSLEQAAVKTRLRDPHEASARLAELDDNYERAVEDVAARINPYLNPRGEQAVRNMRKSRRGGETVKQEVRRMAEARIGQMADKHPNEPFAKMIRERDDLRTALQQRSEKGTIFEGLTNGNQSLGRVRPNPTGMGSPSVERLGGALSVAKDQLAALEKRAAAKIEPSGLVGAENAKAGPGAFYNPDVEKRGRLGRRTRSVNQPKEARVKQSQGTLFAEGRNRLGPKTTVEDALKEIRLESQQADAELAHSFSAPYTPETFDPSRHALLNPEGHKIPRYVGNEQADLVPLDQMTPREIAEHALKDRQQWGAHVFPESVDQAPQEHRLGLRMIDKKLAESITGEKAYASFARDNVALRALDFTNNLNRAALIYLNPSYVPKNFAGNVAFLGLQQISPFLIAKNLRRSSQVLSDLSPEVLVRIDGEAGGGAAVQLAHEGRGVLKAPLQKIADVQGAGADRLPRRAAWLYEAGKRGYRTPAEIEALLTNEKLRPILNEVSEGAQQAMVKFQRAPAGWRRAASRAIFIFPWLEGATRYAGRLPLDRPFAARGANEIRNRVQKYQEKVFGKAGKLAAGGLIPLGPARKRLGTEVVPVLNPTALTPIGTAGEVGHAVQNAATGNWQGQSQLLNFLQPILTAGFEAGSGIDTYHASRYPQGTTPLSILQKDLIGSSAKPGIPLAADAATFLRHPQSQPFSGPESKQPTYVQEGGVVPGIAQAFLGSARPTREVNLPAIQARGRKLQRASMNPVQRAVDDGRQLRSALEEGFRKKGQLPPGEDLSPALKGALRDYTRRKANLAHRGIKTGQPDYSNKAYLADIEQLIRWKRLPASALDVAHSYLAGQLTHGVPPTAKQIGRERGRLTRLYYNGDVLSGAKKAAGVDQ